MVNVSETCPKEFVKNLYAPNLPLLAIIVVLGFLEYYFTVGFFSILSEWMPTAGIWFPLVLVLSLALTVISFVEIGLLLLLTLSREIRVAVWERIGY